MIENVKHNEKKEKLFPQLRFSDFKDSWDTSIFDQITSITRLAGYEYSEYWKEDKNGPIIGLRGYNIGKGRLILRDLSFISNELSKKLIRSKLFIGDIAFPCVGSIGNAVVIEENDKFHIQQNIAKITCKDGYNPYFMTHFLTSFHGMKEVYRFNATSSQPNVLVGSLRQFKINLPTLPEQQKIASFLTAVDQKIQKLTHKKALLENYKKGVLQKIFKQELRFKQDDGSEFTDWQEKRLGEIAERIAIKNKDNSVTYVLTNSATQGVVSQQDYFDKDIANQNNLEGYYIVSIDDFVYNPRISIHAPVGPIKRNKLKDGVMSPLYSVFRFKVDNLEYFEFYFETNGWHRYLNSVANFGARHDRMNITNSDFFKMPIPFPCEQERKNITDFLINISIKIESINNELEQTQKFKKGLLQQMFV